MVISHHKPVLVGPGTDQRHPESGLMGQVAHRGTLGLTHPLDLLLEVEVAGAKLDIMPGDHGIGRDDLHRLVELVAEVGDEVGMPSNRRVHGLTQAVRIQRPGQGDIELYGVQLTELGGIGREAGVKEQPFLQRG